MTEEERLAWLKANRPQVGGGWGVFVCPDCVYQGIVIGVLGLVTEGERLAWLKANRPQVGWGVAG